MPIKISNEQKISLACRALEDAVHMLNAGTVELAKRDVQRAAALLKGKPITEEMLPPSMGGALTDDAAYAAYTTHVLAIGDLSPLSKEMWKKTATEPHDFTGVGDRCKRCSMSRSHALHFQLKSVPK